METKPSHIQPVGGSIDETEFETTAQKAAASAILDHWDETHNLSEIARRTGWSKSHIRQVFHTYFKPADGEEEGNLGLPADLIDSGDIPDELPESSREAFLLGYFMGSKR